MSQILIIGEDALTCELGDRLIAQVLPCWSLAMEPINTGGVTKLKKALPRYLNYAKHVKPVLCIADTDGQCPVALMRAWLPHRAVDRFIIRLAVPEAESWLLADRDAVSQFIGVPVGRIPFHPDTLADAKQTVLQLARQSKVREIRSEIVSTLNSRTPGTGYNTHLCKFVKQHWCAARAAEHSPSLSKALRRLAEFQISIGSNSHVKKSS